MANNGALQRLQGSLVAPQGNIVYVDGTNGSATGSGLTPDSAVTTLALGLTASAVGDIISIAPGLYTVDIGSAAIIPLTDQTWMASVPSHGGAPNVVITADADDTADVLFSIDADNVTFIGLEFKMISAAATHIRLVDAAQDSAVRGLVFLDCWFNLNDQDDAGILACAFDDASNTITGLVMRNCRFTGNDATTTADVNYIEVGAPGIPGAMIEDCVFELEGIDGDNHAFTFADPAGSNKSYGMVIRNNDFIGAQDNAADTVAIIFNGSMTDGEIMGMVRSNFFAGCTAIAVTASKISKSVIRNFVTDSSGGALVDASA